MHQTHCLLLYLHAPAHAAAAAAAGSDAMLQAECAAAVMGNSAGVCDQSPPHTVPTLAALYCCPADADDDPTSEETSYSRDLLPQPGCHSTPDSTSPSPHSTRPPDVDRTIPEEEVQKEAKCITSTSAEVATLA